ncbi:MAG: histidinol-phosphate transaminase [bacterium]|nr:histidinol-phosphate transaminase [bacterium]
MKLKELVNPHIRDLDPYQPGKPIDELERELGIADSIKLASNESPLGPSLRAVEALHATTEELNRYPDGSCFHLREALATKLGVTGDSLTFGCGSDELLEVLAKCFVAPGDEIVFAWPSFAMYPIVAQGMGAVSVPVPTDAEYKSDVGALLAAVTDKTKLLFLANPNNPTGTSIGEAEFSRLVDELPEHVVLVADEAYLEYVRRPDFPDTLKAIARRTTLVSLRTFSKIYGLAGLRIGYVVGDPELISYLERARHPFNVNSLAQAAAIGALSDVEHVARVRELTHAGIDALAAGLERLGLSCTPSDANFLLVDVGDDAGAVYQGLLRHGVITRPMAGFGLKRHLRVTVGLPEENERFLSALEAEIRA